MNQENTIPVGEERLQEFTRILRKYDAGLRQTK